MLAGTKEFVERARMNRKKMGGGMRQVGVLAGPGLVAIKEHRHLLKDDNLIC